MMHIKKENLHALIDIVDQREYGLLYQLLMKFVPTDFATEDEVEALEASRIEIENGQVYRADEIDWDNLGQIHLD